MANFDYKNLKVRVADKTDALRISELRIAAYHEATGSKLQSYDFLKWCEVDDSSLVLYLENEKGQAISSIRACVYKNQEHVAELFDVRLNKPISLPVLAIDKLVTLVEYRCHRLSAVLRYLCIKAAQLSNMGCIALTINDNASRVPLLRDMGYRMEVADISHRSQSVYDNDCKVLLADLPFEKFDQAMTVSGSIIPCDIEAIVVEPDYAEKVFNRLSR